MSKHNHKDDSHFIPSPYRVVTSYENDFINDWNKTLAVAVSDVLKYIAKATSDAIKELKNSGIDETSET